MNKKKSNTKSLIAEMHDMLRSKPSQRLTVEGLVYGEDGDEMMANDMDYNEENENPMPTEQESNPLDEDPAITKLITSIRVQTLQGLTKLAQNPESAQYELLKKIFLLIDKAVEDKVEVEK